MKKTTKFHITHEKTVEDLLKKKLEAVEWFLSEIHNAETDINKDTVALMRIGRYKMWDMMTNLCCKKK